ncbi:CcoQ/FixQ family Cbb3-type cytochrome c oxidase assembly chaperone [Saccharobesus litoralis]|uniref:CcoQ/FixQ family Cbb3-type cytochrome c oxidase assembly chaperone n=1 Tax=Saccharobesus litoralis TaxID=2172099 RepID=A0A2S0VSZ1_9ALTE|nr:cbb3-type cytochrome c oxidase subunit 3 [Saccharobesus litoralis]AWB67336.1 CcoQ/FixQ family Cbb3-type cytochrome c oxidase assembly chaperone [Saccharobesus litoralis]
MDYGTYRGVYTIIMMLVFAGIIWWAYSKSSKSKFDDAANSIFDEDDKKPSAHDEQNSDKELRK